MALPMATRSDGVKFYEALHPETKYEARPGRPLHRRHCREETGQSERVVQRDVESLVSVSDRMRQLGRVGEHGAGFSGPDRAARV